MGGHVHIDQVFAGDLEVDQNLRVAGHAVNRVGEQGIRYLRQWRPTLFPPVLHTADQPLAGIFSYTDYRK